MPPSILRIAPDVLVIAGLSRYRVKLKHTRRYAPTVHFAVARQLSCLVQRQLTCLVDAEIFSKHPPSTI